MHLTRLDIHDLRNFAAVRLQLPAGALLVTGDNGSGKTSLLEAIWLLGTGRSFRSNRMTPVIRYGAASLTVHGEVKREDGRLIGLGITRHRSGESEIKVAGERVRAASTLAAELPVQLLNPDSVEIVTGSPGRRRQFIDWGTFHVEHDFLDAWKSFRRSLDQRNALLRSRRGSADEFDLWEDRLAEAAERIDAMRRAYVARIEPGVHEALDALGLAETIGLHYSGGWEAGLALRALLAEQRAADREAGFTRSGPQRADLRLVTHGRRAAEVLSRGQQKILACALLVAQGRLLEATTDKTGVYLVDDLPAELDAEHRLRLGRALAGLRGQVVVTAVQRDLVIEGLSEAPELTMFHVEQGCIVRQ
ncbi:MAG TPA: DNA replication/repair protein RecF [Pseudomonadales bacterium]|nr:DNA replication/repair protein RecF [Pseudomonadales bacterium]